MGVERAGRPQGGEERRAVAGTGVPRVRDQAGGAAGGLDEEQDVAHDRIRRRRDGQREPDLAIRAEVGALGAVEGDDRERRERGRANHLGRAGEAAQDDEVGVDGVVDAREAGEAQLARELDAVLVGAVASTASATARERNGPMSAVAAASPAAAAPDATGLRSPWATCATPAARSSESTAAVSASGSAECTTAAVIVGQAGARSGWRGRPSSGIGSHGAA